MENHNCHGWSYRAEGNCSLVVCNKQLSRAYRILKVQKDLCENSDVEVKSMYFSLVQFASCVAERLFGEYIDVPMMKSLRVDFLKSLSTMIKMERPDNRQEKTIALCPYVLDLPDYAYLPSVTTHSKKIPSFMFELKPGSVSRRYGMGPHMSGCGQMPSCYYCLNKTLESMTCGGKRVSRYCPQELFSGNSRRMKRCISVLLEDINTSRNKLRLFKDGVNQTGYLNNVQDLLSMLHPHFSGCGQYKGTSQLADLLFKCLTHKQSACRRRVCPDAMSPYSNRRRHHNTAPESQCMPSDCVLSVFASAQSHGAIPLAELTRSYNLLSAALEADASLWDKLCLNGPYDTGMWRLTSQPQTPAGVTDQVMAAFITVRNYLIYRTAKDSSVLITMQPVEPRQRVSSGGSSVAAQDKVFKVSDSLGNTYVCCVAIIDLDPKPFSKMRQYLASEKELQDLYEGLNHC